MPRNPLSTSPSRRVSPSPSATAIGNGGLFVEELSQFEALRISPESLNPRSFPHNVKQQCWEKAEKIKGRDPDRWRRDSLCNTVFRKLAACPGCLCHDYNYIVPYSKVVFQWQLVVKLVKLINSRLFKLVDCDALEICCELSLFIMIC